MNEDLKYLEETKEFNATKFMDYIFSTISLDVAYKNIVLNILNEAASDYCYSSEQFMNRLSKMLGLSVMDIAKFASIGFLTNAA